MEKLGRGLIILAITVALSVLQVPADVKIEQESSASETVKEGGHFRVSFRQDRIFKRGTAAVA